VPTSSQKSRFIPIRFKTRLLRNQGSSSGAGCARGGSSARRLSDLMKTSVHRIGFFLTLVSQEEPPNWVLLSHRHQSVPVWVSLYRRSPEQIESVQPGGRISRCRSLGTEIAVLCTERCQAVDSRWPVSILRDSRPHARSTACRRRYQELTARFGAARWRPNSTRLCPITGQWPSTPHRRASYSPAPWANRTTTVQSLRCSESVKGGEIRSPSLPLPPDAAGFCSGVLPRFSASDAAARSTR
jgi:hypothetical protein